MFESADEGLDVEDLPEIAPADEAALCGAAMPGAASPEEPGLPVLPPTDPPGPSRRVGVGVLVVPVLPMRARCSSFALR